MAATVDGASHHVSHTKAGQEAVDTVDENLFLLYYFSSALTSSCSCCSLCLQQCGTVLALFHSSKVLGCGPFCLWNLDVVPEPARALPG